MATNTTSQPTCQREIAVEIPADVILREIDTAVAKFQKGARIPGFRPGKAPASIVRQYFAERLKSGVIEDLVPRYFKEETEKQGLKPISTPRISDMQVKDGEPLRFKATFEVMPEFEVTGYQELRQEAPPAEVTDAELEQALNNIREQEATYTPVAEDRALQDGDYAQVSFTGSPEGSEGKEPVKVDDVMVEVGGSNTIPEFTQNLRGAKPGEERSFDVVYPQDFADQRLAGKTFRYSVTVKAIKQKGLPELNDDFAKQLGDFENFEAFKQRVRDSLVAEKQHHAEHEAKKRIIDELVARHEFPVPEAMIEQQVDTRLDRGLRALVAQGMKAEQLKNMDFARLREAQRESAIKDVKATLILDRIAEMEHIEVTDEEVNHEVDAIALQSKQTADQVRDHLTKEGALDKIRNRIRNEKTLEFLYHKSA